MNFTKDIKIKNARKKFANQPSRMHNKPLNCLDVMAVVLCEELLVYNKQL